PPTTTQPAVRPRTTATILTHSSRVRLDVVAGCDYDRIHVRQSCNNAILHLSDIRTIEIDCHAALRTNSRYRRRSRRRCHDTPYVLRMCLPTRRDVASDAR